MSSSALSPLIDLFIERVPLPVAANRVAAAQSLLVIDATAAEHRVAAMLRLFEQLVPVRSRLMAFNELAGGSQEERADRIWLLIDEGSDHAYCSLLREDLERSHGVPTRMIAVGTNAEACFSPAELGRCAPWRRRRALAEGARLAARLASEDQGAAR